MLKLSTGQLYDQNQTKSLRKHRNRAVKTAISFRFSNAGLDEFFLSDKKPDLAKNNSVPPSL